MNDQILDLKSQEIKDKKKKFLDKQRKLKGDSKPVDKFATKGVKQNVAKPQARGKK